VIQDIFLNDISCANGRIST